MGSSKVLGFTDGSSIKYAPRPRLVGYKVDEIKMADGSYRSVLYKKISFFGIPIWVDMKKLKIFRKGRSNQSP